MIPAKNHPRNCGIATTTNFTKIFAKSKIIDRNFDLVAIPIQRVLSSNLSSIITIKDKIINRYLQSEYVTDYRLDKNILKINFNNNINISSSNSNILSITNSIATYQNDGQCTILATDETGETSAIGINAKKNTINSIDIFSSWVDGSLAKHITENIDTKIQNLNSNISKTLFSTQDHVNNIYIRNTNSWIANIDSTFISPWNSNGGSNKAGVLISPRHVLFAEHYKPTIGTTIRYVTMNNQVITRTITNILTDPAYTPYYPDILVGVLNEDVPNSISFAKILPVNYINYLPSLLDSPKLPIIVTDQEKNILVYDLNYISALVNFIKPIINNRINFYEKLITGDSGSPCFTLINNDLVLLCTATYPDSGTFVTQRKETINNLMLSLGGGYQLTEINLSLFPSY